MKPPVVSWWTRTGWAGDVPVERHPVVVVGIRGQADRPAARRAIREAALAALTAMTGMPAQRIALHATPGEVPWAAIDDGGAARRAWLSISHDGELSLAALSLDGAVGIDVTAIVAFPDWQAVARDYLGPSTADVLSALPAGQRPAAFARAWSEREARLKCLGLPLAEWDADGERRLASCSCLPLDLPDGYAGSLAVAPALAGRGA